MRSQPKNTTPTIQWQWIIRIALKHKRELIIANFVALLGAIASVPIPLLMPLMVDEVLLHQPGFIVNTL